MSFLNKLQGWGRKQADADPLEADMAFEGGYAQAGGVAVATPPDVHVSEPSAFDATPGGHADTVDASVISEAEPSGVADFSETRQQEAEASAGMGALPLIGKRPIVEQRRILTVLAKHAPPKRAGPTLGDLLREGQDDRQSSE